MEAKLKKDQVITSLNVQTKWESITVVLFFQPIIIVFVCYHQYDTCSCLRLDHLHIYFFNFIISVTSSVGPPHWLGPTQNCSARSEYYENQLTLREQNTGLSAGLLSPHKTITGKPDHRTQGAGWLKQCKHLVRLQVNYELASIRQETAVPMSLFKRGLTLVRN